MKYFKFLFLLILLLNSICYSATENDCKMYYNNKQFDKSSSCYYSLISKDRNNPILKLGYGNSLFAQKKYNAAKIQYNEIVQSYPNTRVGLAAKKNLDITNEMLKTLKTSRSNDSGNYISDITYAKWTTMPIKVWIESGVYSSSAKKAFLTWQSKTQNNVSFSFVDKSQDAQISVYFKKDISKSSSGDALGVTKISYDNRNRIHFAQIDIKSITLTGVKQTPAQVYAVTLHEVGHAIGIKGHSKNQYDVMYPSDDNYRNILSNRDINTIKEIYSK